LEWVWKKTSPLTLPVTSKCRFWGFAAVISTAIGCGGASTPQRQPPGKPPTPVSVNVAEPGGDAHDPHQAALLRQLEAPWGARNDKDDLVWAPTPDWENWKRVRYRGFEHFTGFRYGDDHHVIAVVFVQDVPEGTPVKSDVCMRRFEQWGRPQIQMFDVKFGQFNVVHKSWHDQPLEIRAVDGEFASGFTKTKFSAAWTAYPAYPNACLVYAMAVPWRDHDQLAQKVRDRWVSEGFVHMWPRTPDRPVRK
jgi:hypothetical protein